MSASRDLELERFKRTINLVEYAKRLGYEARTDDLGRGLTVLDHPKGDRLVVAQTATAGWIYAAVSDFGPRAPGESTEDMLARLRRCIVRSKEKGSIVELVHRREPSLRDLGTSAEPVRARLRALSATEPSRDGAVATRPPRASPGCDPSGELPRSGRPEDPGISGGDAPRDGAVDQRLRRWREAQAILEHRVPVAPAVAPGVEHLARTTRGPSRGRDR
jgi:hypothetical protein